MADKNITKVYLLSVPLENDYKNTLYFTSKDNQQSFFASKVEKSYTNFSYQRKDNFIRVPEQFDKLQNINYVMYQNTAYSNKWFYAFVTDIKYVDDGRTDLFIETDYMQTWMFDITVKPSFIEREHVADDTVGLHTIPEDLNIGQIVCDWSKTDESLYHASGWYWVILACNYNPEDDMRYAGVGCYADYPQGSVWFAFLICPLANDSGIKALSDWVYEVSKDGHADDIQEMFVLPYQFISATAVAENHMLKGNEVKKIQNITSLSKSTIRKFNDYEAKNNKLYCYPYSFLRITNNLGSYNDYKIEDFHEMDIDGEAETDNMSFEVIATACQGVSGKIRPKYYQGLTNHEDESLQIGKYPTLSWSSDAFTNWLCNNAVNMGISVATSVVSGVAGAVTGNALGVASGIVGVSQSIGGMWQASMLPNTARGNANAGDVSFNFNLNMFKYMHMRAKKEYLQVIDDYFTMYGYKVNRVKTPNKAHRSRFWYTKTIDVNIDGAIPNKDMQVIKDCYNKGITFWRNANEIQNYSLSNEVV